MSERIPPIEYLQALAAAGRSGSFKSAAGELGVTPSAVSHRIAALETFLGVRLFVRARRGMQLTDEGGRYLAATRSALEQLDLETDRMRDRLGASRLHLRLHPTFAQRWLLPRLGDYTARFPDMEVDIVSTEDPIDFSSPETDVAIGFGDGEWPGFVVDVLIDERVIPVCSPAYLERAGLPVRLDALDSHTLIHCACRPTEWVWWLEQEGVSRRRRGRTHRMSTCENAVEAAVAGIGIALGRRPLVDGEIERGRLVTPFGEPRETTNRYCFATTREKSTLRRVADFRGWLLARCRAQDPAPDRAANPAP